MIYGSAVVFYGLSLVPFAGFPPLTKGILIFSSDLTFTTKQFQPSLANMDTLDKVRYVTFENQLRSKAFF